MARKRKKRTISPDHLAKLQEGRKKAQTHKKRVSAASDLQDKALRRGKYRKY